MAAQSTPKSHTAEYAEHQVQMLTLTELLKGLSHGALKAAQP